MQSASKHARAPELVPTGPTKLLILAYTEYAYVRCPVGSIMRHKTVLRFQASYCTTENLPAFELISRLVAKS